MFEFESKPAGIGEIVKVFKDGEYVGSYFSQKLIVPPHSAYNPGPNGSYERARRMEVK